jgi:hypothetical protein
MNLNRLLDQWEDPISTLYNKELSILLKGITLKCKSSENYKSILSRIISFNQPSSRSMLVAIVGTTNFTIFQEETLEVTLSVDFSNIFSRINYKNHLSFDQINNDYEKFIKKFSLEGQEVKILIKLIPGNQRRINLEKILKLNLTDDLAKKVISNYNNFDINDSGAIDFYNQILSEKDLLLLEIFVSEMAGYYLEDGFNNYATCLSNTKHRYNKFKTAYKDKIDYLDMFLTSKEKT